MDGYIFCAVFTGSRDPRTNANLDPKRGVTALFMFFVVRLFMMDG